MRLGVSRPTPRVTTRTDLGPASSTSRSRRPGTRNDGVESTSVLVHPLLYGEKSEPQELRHAVNAPLPLADSHRVDAEPHRQL
jgi:hypothetical protein